MIITGEDCQFFSEKISEVYVGAEDVYSSTGDRYKTLRVSRDYDFSRQLSLQTAKISTSTNNPSRLNHCAMSALVTLLLIILYGGGAWKFWKGYQNTNFERRFQNRLFLSMLWPVLYVANKSYRQNFSRALKGSRR